MGQSVVGDGMSMVPGRREFDGIQDQFDSHILKSIPHYEESHLMVLRLAEYFLSGAPKIVDIGCSTGTLLQALQTNYAQRYQDLELVGVDPVEGMVAKANENMKKVEAQNFSILHGSFMDFDFSDIDLVTSLFTLQFFHPAVRQEAVEKIHASLKVGGAFICFEKVKANSPMFNDIFTEQYGDFKSQNGYSEEEKANKTRSLRGVMRPFTEDQNLEMFKKAGFSDVCKIFKWMCFEGYLAVK